MTERKVLGKGLAALIPPKESAMAAQDLMTGSANVVMQVPLAQIKPNPQQPRKRFKQTALDELAQSIREKGILQPLLVRQIGEAFQLIAGERRLQAARIAGLKAVPAIVKRGRQAVSEDLELALIENIQREDLNPIEEARAIRQLHEEMGLTQEEIGRRLGRERSTVANSLRLLRLPSQLLSMVEQGDLSAGAARSILTLELEKQLELARMAREQNLSVREIEKLVARMKGAQPKAKIQKKRPLALVDLEEQLKRQLATKVSITPKGKGGAIRIEYYSQAELTRLITLLTNSTGGH